MTLAVGIAPDQVAAWTVPWLAQMRESGMTPLNKIPDEDNDPSKLPDDDRRLEWADEDREIEDRKPDLGEIEEDTSEL